MFKNYFYTGLVAGLFATLIGWAYGGVYASQIVDYTEATGIGKILAFSLMMTMGAALVNFGLAKAIPSEKIAHFILNILLSGISVSLVFYVLSAPDPEFKNADATTMPEFFKGYLMPFLFIPALSYFTFRSLFIK